MTVMFPNPDLISVILLILFFILLLNTKRASPLTGHNVRLSNLLISSCLHLKPKHLPGGACGEYLNVTTESMMPPPNSVPQ